MLFQFSELGSVTAATMPAAIAAKATLPRRLTNGVRSPDGWRGIPVERPRMDFHPRHAAGSTQSKATAVATQAARDRERTSAALTIAIAMAPSVARAMRRARRMMMMRRGTPIAARWATKLRLPSVPPGERLRLKSSVSTP